MTSLPIGNLPMFSTAFFFSFFVLQEERPFRRGGERIAATPFSYSTANTMRRRDQIAAASYHFWSLMSGGFTPPTSRQ